MPTINGQRTFHVCRTGDLQQFYTLYIEAINYDEFGYSYQVWFQQNLAHKLEDAMAKAEKWADEIRPLFLRPEHDVHVEYHDSPRVVKTRHEAFGAEMLLAKSGKVWWANTTQEFWDNWRDNKEELKRMGYSCTKTDGGTWLMFKKVRERDKEYDDLSLIGRSEEE